MLGVETQSDQIEDKQTNFQRDETVSSISDTTTSTPSEYSKEIITNALRVAEKSRAEAKQKLTTNIPMVGQKINETVGASVERIRGWYRAGFGLATRTEMETDRAIIEELAYNDLVINDDLAINTALYRAVNSSAQLALFYYLTSGELESDLKAFKLNLGSDNPKYSLPAEEDEEIKVRLCQTYLAKIETRNKEAQMYRDRYTPSIGMEAEFSLLTPLALNVPKFLRPGINPDTSNLRMEAITPARDDNMFYKALGSSRAYYINEVTENVGEVIFKPSASATTQLRELLQFIKEGRVTGKLTMHFTVGDMELAQDHTEPMQLTAMMIGAGFVDPMFNRARESGPVIEAYLKNSPDHRFYPLHKSRGRILSYKTKIGDTKEAAVEFRGITGQSSFSNVVKCATSLQTLGACVRAVQKAPDQRDSVEKYLAGIWEEVTDEWNTLVKSAGISPQYTNIGYDDMGFITDGDWLITPEGDEEAKDKLSKDPYSNDIGKIAFTSEKNPEFRKKAQLIVIKARAKVHAIYDQVRVGVEE